MHELSVGQAIVDTVAARAAGRPLRCVHVRIGYLRQVVPDSLQFCWEVITSGTALDGCELVVDHVPAVIACRACGARTSLDRPLLVCSACETAEVEVIAGDELQIVSFDLEAVR